MQILDWIQLSDSQRKELLARPAEAIVDRAKVREVMLDVGRSGDPSVLRWTREFDGVNLDQIVVDPAVRSEALAGLRPELRDALEIAKSNIMLFHQAQMPKKHRVETLPGVVCEQWPLPIQRVGLYVPGGSAPLFSTVLMLALPAKLAGCREIVVATPPNRQGRIDPTVLAACELCGVDRVYAMGGIQAIAALAGGTESVGKVNKIFGPGNAWVTEAKRQVTQIFPGVGVDLPAGPSEVLVIADKGANEDFVIWDLLSQAEHGSDSQVILLSDSMDLLEKVAQGLERVTPTLKRSDSVRAALAGSLLIKCENLEQAFLISNNYAPEHLIINTLNPREYLPLVENAGSVFVGPWSPESAGDYASGTNHVLPTSGAAGYSGGVSLSSFFKFITVQELSRDGFSRLAPAIEIMAEYEGLECHSQAARVRRADGGIQ